MPHRYHTMGMRVRALVLKTAEVARLPATTGEAQQHRQRRKPRLASAQTDIHAIALEGVLWGRLDVD